MIGIARNVPDRWNEHQALAAPARGSPFMRSGRKGFAEMLIAAELPHTNLVPGITAG